ESSASRNRVLCRFDSLASSLSCRLVVPACGGGVAPPGRWLHLLAPFAVLSGRPGPGTPIERASSGVDQGGGGISVPGTGWCSPYMRTRVRTCRGHSARVSTRPLVSSLVATHTLP